MLQIVTLSSIIQSYVLSYG